MPTGIFQRPLASERFWVKVIKTDNCWLWQGSQDGYGYGQFWAQGHKISAHRFAYELLVDSISKGLTLDHLCRVRHCVNPGHLEPVTNRENVLRGEGRTAVNARVIHCPKGHPYDLFNTYIMPNGNRHCRECSRRRWRTWRLRTNGQQPAAAMPTPQGGM